MSIEKFTPGTQVKIYVASLPECQQIVPYPPELPKPEFTLEADAVASDEQVIIPVNFSAVFDYPIPAPFYLEFVEPKGRANFVKVVENFEPTDAQLTVEKIKRDIPAGSKATYPLILRNRNSSDLSDNKNTATVSVFESEGWQNNVIVGLGKGLELPGMYYALDPAYNLLLELNQRTGAEVFFEVHYPKPSCSDLYSRGHIFYGFAVIAQMPISAPSDNLIQGNITLTSSGIVRKIDPD